MYIASFPVLSFSHSFLLLLALLQIIVYFTILVNLWKQRKEQCGEQRGLSVCQQLVLFQGTEALGPQAASARNRDVEHLISTLSQGFLHTRFSSPCEHLDSVFKSLGWPD